MPQIIQIIIGAVLLLFSSKGESKPAKGESSGGGVGRFIPWILGILALDYFLNKKNTAATIESIGTDPAATFAQQIRDAFSITEVFGVKVFSNTDEEKLYSLAAQIRAAGVWEKTKAAYQAIFNDALLERLRSELSGEELTKFLSILNGQTVAPKPSTPATPTKPSTPATPGTTGGVGPQSAFGKTAIAKRTEILYTVSKPRKAVQTVKAGETIGVIYGGETQTIGTKKEVYYYARFGGFWGIGATEVVFYSGAVNLK